MAEWKPLPGIPNRPYPYDWNRILSGLLVILWLGILAMGAGLGGVLRGAMQIALPCACIWFPDALGSMTSALTGLDRSSPGCAVRSLGWVALLVLTVGRVLIFGLMS
jgi:hypothetical protein